MPVSSNAYMTSAASYEYVSPIIWSAESEKWIYENSVFQGLAMRDNRYLNSPGRQGNYTLNNQFSMGKLTEGVDIPVSPLSFNQVTIMFFGYGDAKQVSKEALVQSFDYVLNDIRDGFAGAIQENRESVIVTELMTTTSTGIYANGKNSSNILATDTFNTDMIADVKTAMKKTQARKCDAIVIHPDQENAVLKLANFINASQYGSSRVIKSGEIGEYLGIKIMVSNHVTSATENSVTVYKAIAFGRRPFIYAPKRLPEFAFEEETKRSRAITASVWEMFGVTLLRDDSVVIMTSA